MAKTKIERHPDSHNPRVFIDTGAQHFELLTTGDAVMWDSVAGLETNHWIIRVKDVHAVDFCRVEPGPTATASPEILAELAEQGLEIDNDGNVVSKRKD